MTTGVYVVRKGVYMKIDNIGVVKEINKEDIVNGVLRFPDEAKVIKAAIDDLYKEALDEIEVIDLNNVETFDSLYVKKKRSQYPMLNVIMPKVKKLFAPNLKTIGAGFCQGCPMLEKVDMSEVETISRSAFRFCYKLHTINIPKVRRIEGHAFYECRSLKVFPNIEHCEHIEAFAFWGTGLVDINIPQTCIVGDRAFLNSRSLKTVRCRDFTNINIKAFEECEALERFYAEKLAGQAPFIAEGHTYHIDFGSETMSVVGFSDGSLNGVKTAPYTQVIDCRNNGKVYVIPTGGYAVFTSGVHGKKKCRYVKNIDEVREMIE